MLMSDKSPYKFAASTLCLKKLPTFELFVTLSNLDQFSKCFALLESLRNLLQNPHNTAQLTLSILLYYLGKLKIQIYTDIQNMCKKMQTNCILRNYPPSKFVCQPLCCVPLQIQSSYQNLVLVTEYHVDC